MIITGAANLPQTKRQARAGRICRSTNRNPDRNITHASRINTSAKGKPTMSASIKLAAIAALLTVVSIGDTAFARNNDRTGTSVGRLPSDVVYSAKVQGRDPDSHIRFELLRDNNR